jgi:single-strand DNA-binding protein
MAGLNRAQLLGRLGKDPESRQANNQTVTNFSIATSETWKDKVTGEKKETTEWHNIVAWRGVGDIAAKYLKKGDMVYVEGKLKTRSWEKDGVTRYVTEILVDNLVLIGGNKSGGSSNSPDSNSASSAPPSSTTSTFMGEDDLPF